MRELPDPQAVPEGDQVAVGNATFVREQGYWKPTSEERRYDEVNQQPSQAYFLARSDALWYVLDDRGRVRSAGFDDIHGVAPPFTAQRGGFEYELTETDDGFLVPQDTDACVRDYENNNGSIPRQVRLAYKRRVNR